MTGRRFSKYARNSGRPERVAADFRFDAGAAAM